MKPVMQTIFGDGSNGDTPGNCLQAALATIFRIDLDTVPHFMEFGVDWFEQLQSWLRESFDMYALSFEYDDRLHVEGYYLLTGKTERGLMHTVVYKDGKLMHDPHPDSNGLIAPESCCVFVSRLID